MRWWLALGLLVGLSSAGAGAAEAQSGPVALPMSSAANSSCVPGGCGAPVAAVLTRGINITGWFRFPGSLDPAALAAYVSDKAIADLRRAGFDFVRLAIDPVVVDGAPQRGALVTAIRRLQRQGLTVVVSPNPHDWQLETSLADRAHLVAFWTTLAPALQALDPTRTVPEILNEPVFPNDPASWAALQHLLLGQIRQVLPNVTVVLTGQDWGSIGGLLGLTPEADVNVLYSFHFYDPSELTSLAAYRSGLDRAALAQLPFPADDQSSCNATANLTADQPTGDLMRYYCSLGWNAARIGTTIHQAAVWGSEHHVQLLAGEFGASAELNSAARLAWLQTVRDAFAMHGISWALWGYDDVMGFNVSRPPAARPSLDQAILTALRMTTRM